MKIYNDYSISNIIKNAASEKSISKSEFEKLRAEITQLYNSSVSNGDLLKEQTTNVIYQIETGGIVKNFIPSMMDEECIKSMINIHNKIDKNSPRIKEYSMILKECTMSLNDIEKNKYKNSSKTIDKINEKLTKKEPLNEVYNLENRIKEAELKLSFTLNKHKLYFNNLITKLEILNTKGTFEDKRKEFNHQYLALSELIKFEKPNTLDKTDLLKIETYLDKEKKHDKKLDNIIKVLIDITLIYKDCLDENQEPIKSLNAENILNMVNDHISRMKKINSQAF